ncbi:ABC transporter substrate-binding protein [Spiractinospora alimapuensis]|uniref:ABC transporter substrate-binding protein n=1 Tax=Spiractinospora alimapuensis TaxID=2820884 RepID=UPI001F338A91|nr:ABC transporter substrate-binding protein [Spiractinospora alimapuensis]QVQ52205.1 ABC transporter substrate-binding protein [Spiractinospora alimapuensis]
MRRRTLTGSSAVLCLVMAAGCGAQSEDGLASEEESTESQVITLVEQPWEDLMVENQIVSQILGAAGYTVEVEELTVPIGAQSLAQGDADAYLGNWWPSQEDTFGAFIDDGDVEVLSTLVDGVAYEPAVPAYVAEEYDISSLADLARHAEEFEGEFLGIEAGTPGNDSILDMIDEDAYGLGDWELVESGTPAMLAEVERRASEDLPVVFLAWEPHWMNIEWDLVYLEDPEEAWPGAGEIRVATRAGFEEDSPNVARLLSRMEIDGDTASDWIFRVSQDGEDPGDIAAEWIAENPDEVSAWLDGVETVDGDPAELPE